MYCGTRALAIAAAVVHTLLLAAYTLPPSFVPVRLRYWSQAYARVLFHQDWRLFAPDPPACGCSVEFRPATTAPWQRSADVHHHFIWRRMAANACRFAEASPRMAHADTIAIPAALSVSLARMTPEGSLLRMRESCVPDTERITPISCTAHP